MYNEPRSMGVRILAGLGLLPLFWLAMFGVLLASNVYSVSECAKYALVTLGIILGILVCSFVGIVLAIVAFDE